MPLNYDTLTCIILIPAIFALNCDKSFTYYEDYGQNSFNVTCSGITKGYEHILENITINNEISLTITDSVLENITPNIFKNVRNIKILNIFNCSLIFDRSLAIFDKLTKLEVLNIHDTIFDIEKATLHGLGNLKRIQLINNSLSAIAKDGFNYLTNLEKLDLINNHITNVEDLELCELKKLKILNLNNNLIKNLKFSNLFCPKSKQSIGFDVNSEQALSNLIGITYYNITSITNELIDLDLSHNQIIDLGYSFDDLTKLKFINLAFNKLVNVKYVNFKALIKLQKLLLNNNELRVFDSKLLTNKSQLNYLDLSWNYLTKFATANLMQLRYLDVSFNNLTSISLSGLKNLQEANLQFNLLKINLIFQKVPNLITLNLASNCLILNNLIFKNITNLKYLSLSNNSLNTIPEHVFLGLTNLRTLDLSLNNLKNLSHESFQDLNNLGKLNLSNNNIESLPYDLVEPLKNLRLLDIAANKLVFIEYDVILSKLPTLNNINIKSNQLTCENLIEFIKFLKQRHIVYTNSENLDLNNLNQNVAGIPCRFSTVKNNLLVAKENSNKTKGALYNFGICLLVLFVAILTGIVTYRFYIYMKRRRYRPDEFELVAE